MICLKPFIVMIVEKMFSYYGGKSNQTEWIAKYIPYDIKTYAEPFSGAFWVYFKAGFNSSLLYLDLDTIVYNDFSKNNVNLFRCIKKYKEFYDYIKDIPTPSDDLYHQFRDEFYYNGEKTDLNAFQLTAESDFSRGLKYIYLVTHTFSGAALSSSRNVPKGSGPRLVAFKRKLIKPLWIDKIKKITNIENLDYKDCILKYDSKDSFFYTDPPYFKGADYSVNTFDNIGEHYRLSQLLKSIKGRFILSYYNFKELEEWFPKNKYIWRSKIYKKSSGSRKGAKVNEGEELLIMNYEPPIFIN